MIRHLINIILAVCCLLMFPVCAFAQDSDVDGVNPAVESVHMPKTAKDNFGGVQIGADILLGAGRCDDRAFCKGVTQSYDEQNIEFVAIIGIKNSYMWGEDFFFGYEINAHYQPILFGGGDLRFKMLMPIDANDGIAASVGFGLEINGIRIGALDGIKGAMYIPVQIGYDHVSDNGFVIGVSVEAQIAFQRKDFKDADSVKAALGFIGGGIQVGYQF